MLRRSAGWLARWERLPTSLRAVFGYYGDAGIFDYQSLQLKRRVDETVDGMIDKAFVDVERAIGTEFDRQSVTFEYDTKLVLPAKLTLGYLYRRLDEEHHVEAEAMTRLAVEALLDGDMRDALNDDELADFSVDFDVSPEERRTIAELAQEVLQTKVHERFKQYPDAVKDEYEWAVDISERHQQQDDTFREYLSAARAGDDAAVGRISDEYREAEFSESPAVFTAEQLAFPYVKTQYDRVGVIYDAMIEMYRHAGLPIEAPFHRSIVLAIIGAQVWLDDIDDYAVDLENDQLTPVTAEYVLAESDREAYESVISVGELYLDHAKREATAADSALTGIATEYILRDGNPAVLPGSDASSS